MRKVLIHSKPILDFENAARLYYYCRAVDTQGQGWVRLGLQGLSNFFSTSERSIQRWAKQAQAYELIQRFEIGSINGDKYIYVKYSSVKELNQLSGGNFARAKVSIDALKDLNGLKALAVEIAVAAQQDRVERAILHNQTKKVFTPQLPEKPKGSVCKQRSKSLSGCEFVNWATNTFFVRPSYEPISCAQETLAKNLDISVSTVKKLLKNLSRVTLFSRIYSSDERAGNRYTFCPYKTKAQKEQEQAAINAASFEQPITKKEKKKFIKSHQTRLYLQRPSYYFVDKSLDVRLDKRQRTALPVYLIDKEVQTLKQKNNQQDSKAAFRASKRVIAEWMEDQAGIKKVRPKKDGHFGLSEFSEDQIRKLAHNILKQLKGQTSPLIDQTGKLDLIEMIEKLVPLISEKEKELIKLMVKRMKKRKSPFIQSLAIQTEFKCPFSGSIPALD